MTDTRQKCLITGISGLLGSNLAYYFRNRMDILGLYHRHPVRLDGVSTVKCDLTDRLPLHRLIEDFNPDVLIHCASITDIDACEANREHTRTVNVQGTKNISEFSKELDVKLVYISTDAVYDGISGGFAESDEIRPRNYYGLSKYEGEIEIQKKERALIFRTNIFGWNILDKVSLGEWVIRALKDGESITGFTDAVFSSIYTMELARVIDIALKRNLTGTFNCGSATATSKYEFCRKVAGIFGLEETLIIPSSVEAFGFRAERGKNLSLDVDKLQDRLKYKLPTLDYCIESFYRDYHAGIPQTLKSDRMISNRAKLIGYGRQWINNDDIQSVAKVLKAGPITQGPKVKEFEDALSAYCGSEYAVAVNSGTSGLHIACLAAGINAGDEGITSPITFVASSNCIVYCAGKPVFADIDDKTYNILSDEIEKRINSRTRIVIPVHFAGQSCDMERIHAIVKDAEKIHGNKIFLVEDASHALGSKYKQTIVGSCAFSDMVVMSFHPVKHITTAEGGVVLTNSKKLYHRLCRFRSHGITSDFETFRDPEKALDLSDKKAGSIVNPWYYEQLDLGYNYRLTDIQSTLGMSQLKRIEQFKKRRRKIVDAYNAAFKDIDTIQTPFESAACDSNFHLYVLLFDFERIGLSRAQFIIELKRKGIQTQVHYIPVHTQPFYQKNFGLGWGDYANAEKFYQQCLSIPLFPAMKDDDIEKVIQTIRDLVVQQ